MRKISEYLKHPFLVLVALEKYNLIKLNDEYILKKLYRYNTGKTLNLEMPKTFNEKIQWLKLNDRKDIYTKMVDKYAVKEIVKNIIGEKYIIPTLGVWDHFSEIDFDLLPQKFVLKSTHDSGGIVICKNKEKLDIKKARKKIEKSLKYNYFYYTREWPYKNVKPQILIEKFMSDSNNEEIKDYKLFCFNGEPKITLVCSERFSSNNMCETWFDNEWNIMPFSEGGHRVDNTIKKPLNFELMKELAKKLSNNIPFLRVDFYEINNKLYFGELTFYPASGFEKFEPEKWNSILGDMIILPEDK